MVGGQSGRSWRKTTRKVEGGQVMQQFTLTSTSEHNRTAFQHNPDMQVRSNQTT